MPIRRTSVAIAAIAAAGLVPAIGSAATAAGHGGHGSGHGAGQSHQLTHQIAVVDSRLLRIESSHAVTSLADTDEQTIDANIEADRVALAGSATRQQVRSFRVENYILAVTILHRAANLSTAAAAVPSAQDELSQAITAALALTASSSKVDVRVARSHVDAAQTAIDDDAAGGTDDSTDGSDGTTDGTGDGSGDDLTP